VEKTTGRVAGYYTLSAADVAVSDLPADMTRRLPRYPSVPAARIGRLAVDRRFQGRGLGAALLLNAAMRALRSEIAVFALVVDAKDDEAAVFYRHHGFYVFASNPLRLIAPIETFRKLVD
jgi:ribosomal protein S18 acetylase RimI-like enzyme